MLLRGPLEFHAISLLLFFLLDFLLDPEWAGDEGVEGLVFYFLVGVDAVLANKVLVSADEHS